MGDYTIQSGDTLSGIAAQRGTTVRALMQQNPQLSDPNKIQAGASLSVPDSPPAAPAADPALESGAATDTAETRCEEADDGTVCGCPCEESDGDPAEDAAGDEGLDEALTGAAAPNPMDETEFGKEFAEKTGGLKLSEAIAQYEADTGKTLTPEKVEELFSDPVKSGYHLTTDSSLNGEFRQILNQNLPASIEDAEAAGWTPIPDEKNLFHNPAENVKFVSPNGGNREAIYNRVTGQIDTTPEYTGTFNFFGPQEAGAHTGSDVVPWAVQDGPAWAVKASEPYVEAAGDMASRAGTAIKDGAVSVGGKIADGASNAADAVGKTASDAWDWLTDW